ncbi:hypothetical protein [Ruficoccus sp. ZRK36]|uniref:hypothetical protein n=1 Tax=Ruficoccus sp. ZRK36 TaxID=2866311 RepID=UPI001C735951|nr:hypothetical protein [Ruficoccus sp. ZRK36]QYY36387.1 hypothetical protein K0V07_02705 [Ruficoccus sp. ZRK36]
MSEGYAIIISAVLGILSLVGSHQFAAWRDRENKRREQRINYLISVYRKITRGANSSGFVPGLADDVQQALADIQVFGSVDQIKLAREFALDLANKKVARANPIISSLRDSLRKELGLTSLDDEWFFLTIPKQ